MKYTDKKEFENHKIMIRCVLFHNDFGNSLCYNEFNLRYRTASTNLEFD